MPIRLAVVVASPRSFELLGATLAALRPQCDRLGATIVVARPAGPVPESARNLLGGTDLVTAPADATLPVLRGTGLARADADWVGLTEDNCLPDSGWLEALLAAAAPGVAVVGGSMGNALVHRSLDWGAFFSEYGFYGRNRPSSVEHLVTDASVLYERSVLDRVSAWALAGSWEDDIHLRLHQAGERFGFAPAAIVRQNEPQRFLPFCANRFDHGRQFAAVRSRNIGRGERLLRAIATPLLPLVLLARIARAAGAESPGAFVRASPFTLAFLAAWAAGELSGYLVPKAPSGGG